jgi:hypothetical protein
MTVSNPASRSSAALVQPGISGLRKASLPMGSALLFVFATVGCTEDKSGPVVDANPGKSAIDTKGAAAKDAGAPPGVMPPKGKGKAMIP